MNRTWAPFHAASDTKPDPNLTNLLGGGARTGLSQPVARPSKRNGRGEVRVSDQIRSTTLSFRNMHEYGDLLPVYLEARKEIFRDQLDWDVSESDGMEFDQYDTPACRWIVVHRFGQVLGGVRMMPTTSKCGIYSYMIRDAQIGLLADIPTDVLFFEAPVEHNVWEATRFFITDAVPAQQRLEVQGQLFKSMSQTAMENGATHVLGIVPAIWARWARRLGVNAAPIGAKFSIDGTSSQSVLFKASDFIV